MSTQFARVKYSLYNSDSLQADSDDDDASDSCSNLNSKYISRKIRFCKETKVELENGLSSKSFDESDIEPTLSVHQILRNENLEALRQIMNNLNPDACRIKVNLLDDNKRAPLHYAARYNLVPAVQLLIEKGANVNVEGEDGLTPLHFAARYGYNRASKNVDSVSENTDCHDSVSENTDCHDSVSENTDCHDSVSENTDCHDSVSENKDCHDSVISILIEEGANVNCQDNYGMTPLHYAAIRGNLIAVGELLKSNKINTEISDKQEMTALHCAANYNSPHVVEQLLKAKAHPKATDENMATPLHLAATTGSKKIVNQLITVVEMHGDSDKLKEYIDERNLHGNTALHLAVTKGHLEIVEILLQKGADVKRTIENLTHPLHLAAISGNVEIVKCLFQHGADVNCINSFSETPLHKASAFDACDIIEYLLKNGADIEYRDNANFTPLLVAVAEGHSESVKLLLKYEANIEVVDNMDRNLVFWASQENHVRCLRALLINERSKILINRCDHYDNSPLHIAALKGYSDIASILIDNGAEIEKKNEHEQTPLHLAAKNGHISVAEHFLSHSKSVVNTEDENSNTPVHLAALSGHYPMISVLLNVGANFEARNCYLWTALHCAASQGWKRCCQILLKAGSVVDSLDKSKATPLHLASKEGHKGVVKLLLKCGADIACCDKTGKNCLDMAIDYGHEDVALEILADPNWEDVLRNESDKNKFHIHQTPLRRLILQMPTVAETVLDKCIVSNNFPEDHTDYAMTYNYEFLDDMFACYKPFLYDGTNSEGSSSSGTSVYIGSDIYDDSGNVRENVRPYVSDKEILKYNHPLMLMVTNGRENLLSHPLCETLLLRKWKYYGRYVYYSNLLVFVLFLTFLTGYVVTAVAPCPIEDKLNPKCCAEKNVTCQPFIGDCDMNVEQIFPKVCRNFIYVLAVIHLLKEIYQIYQNGMMYINLENALEWSCYVSSILYVADLNECSAQTGIRQVWQWELGSLCIFSAWMVLLMFISKFPFLGIYVVMFLQILNTFVKFSFVFFLFVVAFALGFYTVLQNQNPFESPGESIVKTGVMMIGEIEFDGIFNDPDNIVFFKGPAYTLFIIFLLVMSVIIMNLLVGLAVDDIKGVQEKAELQRLAMKVELVLTVERILPVVVLRKCVFKFRNVRPNTWKSVPWYLKFFKVNQTLPSTKSSKSHHEEFVEEQMKLTRQIKMLKESLLHIQKEVKSIHALVKKEKQQ